MSAANFMAGSDEGRLQAKVANLNASLDDLEAQLEPLFTKSLPETLVGLETIQQAKLQVALPYVLYDLVFGNASSNIKFL